MAKEKRQIIFLSFITTKSCSIFASKQFAFVIEHDAQRDLCFCIIKSALALPPPALGDSEAAEREKLFVGKFSFYAIRSMLDLATVQITQEQNVSLKTCNYSSLQICGL